jgi:hypothetical protein
MKFALGLGVMALCGMFCQPVNAQSTANGAKSEPLNLNPPGITLSLADRYHLLQQDPDETSSIAADTNPVAADRSKTPSGGTEIHPPGIKDVPPWEVTELCDSGKLRRKDCKFHWLPALREQTQYLFIETGWNLAANVHIWEATTHGHWLEDWIQSVNGFTFTRWNDSNPISDDYVGHPMMGAISMNIFLQNYPRGQSFEIENSKRYWHTRLWALLWTAVYSTEWKLGPISEASFGNTGRTTSFDRDAGHKTNGTGDVGLVITPLGGWVWTMGEDFVDLHLIRYADQKTANPVYLFLMGFANPTRSFANLMRFKAPWYRDSRPVRPHRTWPTFTDGQEAP